VVRGWSCIPTTTTPTTTATTRRQQTIKKSFEQENSYDIFQRTRTTTTTALFSSDVDSSPDVDSSIDSSLSDDVVEVSAMRLSEMKSELKERKIDFSDCFDKESLILKLIDARQNKNKNSNSNSNIEEEEEEKDSKNENEDADTFFNKDGDDELELELLQLLKFDRSKALEELKGMRVRELREELGRRRIPRAGLFEKDDIVKALLEAREKASVYSSTGLLTPGEVSDLMQDDVKKEIEFVGSGLLLVDVYATWCGPCQMIAPLLKEIALEEGDKIRIIKMDSDKNPTLASELKVGGLPTLVLFSNGNEIDRLEGAPNKEQLTGWINSHR
ncbi:MAG: thioredoxin 1, partial [Bacillariaceae sp.]